METPQDGLRRCNRMLRESMPYTHDYTKSWVKPCGCYREGPYIGYYCDTHHEEIIAELIAQSPKPMKRSNSADDNTEYAFTLTMPPNYDTKKPIEEVARLICTNGLTNKPYEKPEKWAYVLEHTEAGTAHIHGMYKTPSGRRIAAKYFQRYWPLWDEKIKLGHGHKGGYHQKARHNESYVAYMGKEGCVHSSETKN